MMRDFATVWSERALLLSGLGNTVLLSVLAGLAALVLGALLSTLLMSPRKMLQSCGNSSRLVFRRNPPMGVR